MLINKVTKDIKIAYERTFVAENQRPEKITVQISLRE